MLASDQRFAALRAVFQNSGELGGLPPDDPDAPFKAIIDDLPDRIVILSPDGTVLYGNRLFLDSIESTSMVAVGKNLTDISNSPRRMQIAELRQQRFRDLSPDEPATNMHFTDGGGRTFEVIYKGLFNSDRELVAVIGLGRDRTEEFLAQEQLRAANALLADSNRDLQDFAHIASHDLQEPLRKISAFSERLSHKYSDELDERGQDYLARIGSASSRMQQLVNSLLDYARVTSRAGEVMETDLNQIVAMAISDLELVIEETGATVELDQLPVVICDPVQLRQVFQNLIGNALKFHRPDVAPIVRVKLDHGHPVHRISVTDNGIGFEQEYADKIFGPFQRLHARTDYAGSGIGLSVCRRIVERHGGVVTATSTLGEGATFSFTLAPSRESVVFTAGLVEP